MTVKELIKQLKKCNPDALVIKSKDAEGNGYEEVDSISEGEFNEKDQEYYDQLEEDEMGSYSECVCLW